MKSAGTAYIKRITDAPGIKTLEAPWWTLCLIEIFTVWQMGIVYYATTAFTVNGVTPLPVDPGNMTLVFALGYAAAAVLMGVAPQHTVLIGKISLAVSAACTSLLLTPTREDIAVVVLAASVFCCVLMIGVSGALAVNFYSSRTALKDGLIASVVCAPGVVLLQGGFFETDARAFLTAALIVQALSFSGLCLLPGRPLPPPAGIKARKELAATRPPAILLWNMTLLFGAACLCTLFSSSMAETIPHGVVYLYGGLAAAALLFFAAIGKRMKNPIRTASMFLLISAFGFLMWLIPGDGLKPVSLFLQGSGIVICNIGWFLAGTLYETWPSRIIAPVCISLALATVVIHAAALETFRDSVSVLYMVYAAFAAALLMLYLFLEPLLVSAWNRANEPAAAPARSQPEGLTPREREVTELVSRGYSNTDIARLLHLSDQTVKSYLKSIYQKMDVHSRAELIVALVSAK